jgi:PAS domain S-box-containing protein
MSIRAILLLILLIGAGFLGNYFTLPLFFGADFLFGSIAVLLVLYFYGLGWGMLAAGVASSYTWFLWGHPYGVLTFTSEALFVGIFLWLGRRNLLVLDGVFWLLLGIPLNWLCLGMALHMDATTISFIMLKQGINGIFNALLANLAICFFPFGKLFQQPTQTNGISLKDSLFNLLVMMVLLPALLLTMLEARNEKKNLEVGMVAELQSVSANLQFHLHSWFRQRLQAVQELAGLAVASSMTPTAQLQHETEILKQTFPDFKTLHVENALGRTIAYAPKVNEKGEFTLGHDFSDRMWFKESKAQKKPVVSEVFHGRLGVLAPTVAIAAPVMREQQWLGTAAAALDLQLVQAMLQSYSRGKTMVITLTDSTSKTIASTAPDRVPMQVWNLKKTGGHQQLKDYIYHWYPEEKELPSMTRWRRSFYVHEVSMGPELPWRLTVEAPVQQALYSIYVENLTIMAIITALALFFSLILSRWLTRPLAQLSRITAELPQKLVESKTIDWPATSALEIKSLITNAQSMACTLEESFHNIQAQRDELRQVNQELNQEILERQRAEMALRESEERFRLLVDQSFDGILIHENFRTVDSNQQLTEITGYSRSEFFDIRLIDLFIPDSQQRIDDYIRSKEKGYFETELRRKDGQLLQIESFGAPCRFHGREARIVALRNITDRKRAEEALSKNHRELQETSQRLEQSINMLQLVIESTPVRVFWKSRDLRYLGCNTLFARDAGFSQPEQLLGLDDFAMGWRDQAELYRADDLQVMDSGLPKMNIVEPQTTPAGVKIWLNTSKVPLQMPSGEVLGVLGVYEDITERKQAEEIIKASLEEKEVLLKEIYHRTKNNMQVICSLLNLQSARFNDPQLKLAFQDTGNRVRSMAMVHEKLYQTKNLSHIDLKDYIKDLANFLLVNYLAEYGKISLHLDLHSVIVNIETAMPCGLMINEIVSNAIKYAFPGERKGTISILLSSTKDRDIELRVADDGVGLPPELDIWNSDSLGLKLAINLAKSQLQGRLEIRREPGTEFRIIFRELHYKPRI